MKLKQLVTHGALILALGAGSAAVAAQESHDHDGHAAATPLKLDNGKKWQTDAPLRNGMEGIRKDLTAALPAIHQGTLPAKQYDLLANKINGHVEYVVKNCKLTPEADAQLHVVLGRIAQGVEAMKTADHRQEGAAQIAQALDVYGDYFQHPNWRPVAH